MSEHILHVRADPEHPDDRDDDSYSITCPRDPNDMTRQCVAWEECRHPVTDEQRDELSDEGETPCPEGAAGIAYHQSIAGMVCHPMRACVVAIYDYLSDAADGLELEPGDYPVDYDVEDFDGVTLHLVESSATGSAS